MDQTAGQGTRHGRRKGTRARLDGSIRIDATSSDRCLGIIVGEPWGFWAVAVTASLRIVFPHEDGNYIVWIWWTIIQGMDVAEERIPGDPGSISIPLTQARPFSMTGWAGR